MNRIPEPTIKSQLAMSVDDSKKLQRIAFHAGQKASERFSLAFVLHRVIAAVDEKAIIGQLVDGAS